MLEKILLALTMVFSGWTSTVNETVSQENLNNSINEKDIKTTKSSIFEIQTNWNEDYSRNGYESFNSVIETKDGNFVCVGETTVLDNVSLGDGVIIKYSKEGGVLWEQNLLGDDTDYYTNLIEDNNGNIYVVGKTFSSDLGFINDNNNPEAIIVKYTQDGNQDWIINYNDGGRQINYNDIVVSGDNLFIVGNRTYNGSRTGFMQVSTSSDGLIEKLVYFQDTNYDTNLKSIITLEDNSLLLLGNSINKQTLEEYPIAIKVDNKGDKIWSYDFAINSTIGKEGSFNSATELSDGSILLAGYTKDSTRKSSLIVKLNKDGSTLWENDEYEQYSEECKFIAVNKDDEVITTCEKTPLGNYALSSDLEIAIKRYNSNGDLIEDYLLNDSKNIEHTKTILTSDNKLVFVGKSYSTELDVTKCTTRDVIDECLDSNSYIAVAEIFDICTINQLPEISILDEVVTINKGDVFNVMDGVSALDGTTNITNKVVATPSTIDTSSKGTHTITYKVSDECGETTETRVVNVVDPCDTNNLPVITIDNRVVSINKGDTFNVMTGVTATDEGTNVTNKVVATPSTIDTSSKGTHTITYKVSDECGEIIETRVVNVVDPCDTNNLPVITIDNRVVSINKGDTFNVMDGVSATDEDKGITGKDITDRVVATPNTIDTSSKGTHTITYKVSDDCGETTETRTINVIDSCDTNSLPVININEKVITINKGESINLMNGVTATDEGVNITNKVVATPSTIDTSSKGTHTITYKVGDECGETTETRVVNVIDSCDTNNLPVININEKVVTINKGESINLMNGVTATDEGVNITNKVVVTPNTIDTSSKGTHTITYKVSDECGETLETRVINIVDPCEINGEVKIYVNSEYVTLESGVSFDLMKDVRAEYNGQDITNSVIVTPNAIDTSKEGLTEVIYKVITDCGEVTKKIEVVVTKNPCQINEAPVIDTTNLVLNIELGQKFNPLDGVTATDKENGDITNRITIIKNTVNENQEGEYEVVYSVVDDCGLTTEKAVVIKVTLNPCNVNNLPEITVSDKEVFIGKEFNPLEGVIAKDGEDDITSLIKIKENTVDINKIGEYSITYTVSDECETVEKTIKVNVKEIPEVKGEEDEIIDENTSSITKPQTGDIAIFPYVILSAISIVLMFIMNKRKE